MSLPDQITIRPIVYVLELEDDCYYVGITYNLNNRLSQHWEGTAAKWTKLHKPVAVILIEFPSSMERENELTLEFIKTYGADKVKGGRYCK